MQANNAVLSRFTLHVSRVRTRNTQHATRLMIIDLERFVASERPYWDEFEQTLDKLDASPDRRMSLDGLRRFHLLYERTSAALAKMVTFSSEPQTRAYLEHLVARGYSELH